MTDDVRRRLVRLRDDGLFPNLPDSSIDALVKAGRQREFDAGHMLFREGRPATAVFVVLEGHVEVSRSANGRMYVLHHERAGGTLGEVPVFSGTPYLANATARLACTCLTVSAASIRRLVAIDPHLASWVIDRLGARIVELVKRLESASALSTTQRIARYLYSRSERTSGRFRLGMSQEEVARELGTVREVVSRTLSRLSDERVIERHPGGWISADRNELKKLANET